MHYKTMNSDYNQAIKAKVSVSKVMRTSNSKKLPEYQIKLIVKKLLLSLRAMAQHHNGAFRNDSCLRPPPPASWDYSLLKGHRHDW